MEVIIGKNQLKYQRINKNSFSDTEIITYAENFDYSFLVSYTPLQTNIKDVLYKESAVIEILNDDELQLLTYRPTCRNEIRRSFKTTELQVEINATPLTELYDFHKTCENERNWKPVPIEELQSSLIFCIRFNQILIAGISAYGTDDYLRIGRIFSRRRSNDLSEIPAIIFSIASRRLIHEITRYCYTNQFKFLDLGGIDSNDPSKKGITDFKLSFGSVIKPVYLGRLFGKNYTELQNYIISNQLDLT